MQSHDGYLFHLDTPRERPQRGEAEITGWIAAMGPLGPIRLKGAQERALLFSERPDVRAAFPGHPFVMGFVGRAGEDNWTENSLTFGFTVGEKDCEVREVRSGPPVPPPWWQRLGYQVMLNLLQWQLTWARNPEARWQAALRLWEWQNRCGRGGRFARAEGDALLACFAEHFPEAVVLQIGANDGEFGDPLAPWFARTRWRGVLVEPLPHLCARLEERYRGRAGVVVERAAIAERDGVAPFYRLRMEPGVTPTWFEQLGTLDRAVLVKHGTLIPEIEKQIVEDTVPTLSVASLLHRHRLQRIDLLVIDTEGYDYRILQQCDLARLQPKIILFEHQHLSPADKAAAYEKLRAHAYTWRETPEGDAVAWKSQDRRTPKETSPVI